MAKRRGNNEGSVMKRKKCPNCSKVASSAREDNLKICKNCGEALPKEGIWMTQTTIGVNPSNGKPIRKSFYGKTRKEAVDKMNKVLNDLSEGSYSEPTIITLEKWLKDWLSGRKPHISESTWITYETKIRVHIIPELGSLKLKDLKTRDIQKLLNDKFENGRTDGKGGLSPRSVKYIYQTLNTALQQAKKERIINYNPAEAVELPKGENKEMKTLSVDELKIFLETAKSSPLYPAFILVFYTGLRRGELLGLSWSDINFNNGTLTVRKQLVKGKKYKDTKTPKSRRTITLHKDAIEVLKNHKKKQNEIKLILGQTYQDNGFVFCTDDGKPLDPDNFSKHFQRILKRAGIPKSRFHNTRHTFATLALEAGVELKTVQEILGHSSISITGDIYSHVTAKMQEEAANKVGGVMADCIKNNS